MGTAIDICEAGHAASMHSLANVQSAATIFVVDGDRPARDFIEALAGDNGWHTHGFEDMHTFLSHPQRAIPSCLLVDVDAVDVGAFEFQKHSDLPVIFTAKHACVRSAVRAMKAGASEFLTKPFDENLLLDAIEQALQQSRIALSRNAAVRRLRERFDLLSQREREVMQLIVAGKLNKQAADQLGISEITVKAHRGKVMRKMHAASLPDLVTMAAALRDLVDVPGR